MKNFIFLIFGLIIIVGSVVLFLKQPANMRNPTKIININGTDIKIEVADTPETREQGLSGRESLAEGFGMLFIFDIPSKYGFWMKDMNFAIDIVWIDEQRHVAGVESSVKPETFPLTFYPKLAVKYVLELPAGFADSHAIDIGSSVYFK